MSRSPTVRLLAGLGVTLSAVALYSGYTVSQLHVLEHLQGEIIDRNRADSLLLLRIQNNLNSLGLAMRDMLDGSEPYPLTAWQGQFRRIRTDLDDALGREAQYSPLDRDAEQRQYLTASLREFWDALDRIFALAGNGQQAEARALVRLSLQARQEALSTAVARLLVQNNETEQQAAAPYPRRLCGRRAQRVFVRRRHAGADPAHRVVRGAVQSPDVPGGGDAVGAAQRTGAAVDRHAGEYLPIDLARTAR